MVLTQLKYYSFRCSCFPRILPQFQKSLFPEHLLSTFAECYESQEESQVFNTQVFWFFSLQRSLLQCNCRNGSSQDSGEKFLVSFELNALPEQRFTCSESTIETLENCLLQSVLFLYPLKTSENLWFSNVFRGCRNGNWPKMG